MGANEITHLFRTMEAGVIGDHDNRVWLLVQEALEKFDVLVAVNRFLQDAGEEFARWRDRREDPIPPSPIAGRHDWR